MKKIKFCFTNKLLLDALVPLLQPVHNKINEIADGWLLKMRPFNKRIVSTSVPIFFR